MAQYVAPTRTFPDCGDTTDAPAICVSFADSRALLPGLWGWGAREPPTPDPFPRSRLEHLCNQGGMGCDWVAQAPLERG
jgi:hypothetical protein